MLLLVFPVVICGVALARAYGEIDEDFVHDWADAHGLVLTTGNRPLVWWYLRNARVLRTLGVLAGMVLPGIALYALGFGLDDGIGGSWTWIFGGHLVGAVYAEIALRRPAPAETRTASLERREVGWYLPARLRFAPTVAAVSVVASAVAAWRVGVDASDRSTLVVSVAVAPVIVVAVAAVQRWIVHRPQPFAEPELIAADDAIRSQSIHMLAGSATAILVALVGENCLSATILASSSARTALTVVGLASVPLSLVFCLYYGHRSWRVRRTPFLRTSVPSS